MRLKFNNMSGQSLTFSSNSATTGTFGTTPGFPTIASPDYAVVVVEPDTPQEEITYLTAYTSGNPTGTFTRGQEGSTAIAHSAKSWKHGPTAADVPLLLTSWLTDSYSVNPTPAATTAVAGAAGSGTFGITVPAASYARTAMVVASFKFNKTNSIRATLYIGAVSNGQGPTLPGQGSLDGNNQGITLTNPIPIPADNATHFIGINYSAVGDTNAMTIYDRNISAYIVAV